MGDRVLMQVYSAAQAAHGPVVYCHWLGDRAPQIMQAVIRRMQGRKDVDYTTARLVQECCLAQRDATADAYLGIGCWNAPALLTAADSHGDAGCVLLNVDNWQVTYLGGYLRGDGTAKTGVEQAQDGLYARMATMPLTPAQ